MARDPKAIVLSALVPEAPTAPAEALAGLRLGDLAPDGRPYVALNTVCSVDGRAVVEGGSRALSGPADREVFHHLRAQADAVMVGAGTARAERYRPLVRDAGLAALRRSDESVTAEPTAVIVSDRLDLPADLPLLADAASRVLVLTSAGAPAPAGAARIEVVRAPGPPLDLAEGLARLRTEHGIRSLLCEGGPTLNGALLAAGLVDEVFLTLAPVLAGGAGPTMVEGLVLPGPLALDLVSVLGSGSDLFLRLRVRR
jgi:riboflavin-specific deaminase-like protein